ncbi:flavodoxin reductase [Meridianimarinicoccus roseus]|uniref:Flavodoxin reductase n=1 Tax=Meridianimarinicoccus roseus TaxID=2072018 RepID=A0A2V2LBN3_9RHOB|nr:FAD-binding oxidoreductase [Meridianimarinicoccus roseus]PWR01131.1 flavodoxin reductase [Meridianimarinicoccus roseus]
MTHIATLRQIENVTHDTVRLDLTRPEGFRFTAGQAVDLSIQREGWRSEERPFTLTGSPDDPEWLEFIIKIYPDHDGVTRQIGQLTPGATLHLSAPWGAIRDAGPGLFVAGGAGVTPFVPILRARAEAGTLDGCHLVYANRGEADIILRRDWEAMAGLRTSFVVDEAHSDLPQGPIDAALLRRLLDAAPRRAYLCGPPGMMEALPPVLAELGLPEGALIAEDLS